MKTDLHIQYIKNNISSLKHRLLTLHIKRNLR